MDNETSSTVRIDWGRYIQAIYCLHYLPYRDRVKPCIDELAKMDIPSSRLFRFYWTYSNPFDKMIVDRMPASYVDFHNDRVAIASNVTLAYYRIFKEAIALGLQAIITVEDDIQFSSTREEMLDVLDHLPQNWDYIHFDKILCKKEFHRLVDLKTDGRFIYGYVGGFWGAVFCMWSRRAMEYTVNLLEKELWPVDYFVENRDDDSLKDLHLYVPLKNLVYQIGQEERYKSVLY